MQATIPDFQIALNKIRDFESYYAMSQWPGGWTAGMAGIDPAYLPVLEEAGVIVPVRDNHGRMEDVEKDLATGSTCSAGVPPGTANDFWSTLRGGGDSRHGSAIIVRRPIRPTIWPGPSANEATIMTKLLFHNNSYLKEFEATVTEVVDQGVVLDRTAFYIGGGGQPHDTGVLVEDGREYRVTRVGRSEGKVVHHVEGAPPPVGTRVTGRIDWDRRYLLMRTHTALHILCGVVWRDYGAQVTGGDMQPGAARMDFEMESMSGEFAHEVESRINAEVAAARDVIVANLSRAEADQNPDLIRTKINLLPASIKEVRTIDISGLDLQADGGTHVANTKEVGAIKVVGHESKGRINKRLRIELVEG